MTPLERLAPLVGTELGTSEWMTITQDRINLFTEATDDPQWIHIDPERAATGPFGATIAQGYLTMSLLVPLGAQIPLPLDTTPRMAVNYGLDRLRFPAPVRVDSRIRAVVSLAGVEEVAGGIQVRRTVTIEIEGEPKPAAVAETVTRLYF
ncbi:MAG: MaoC family dehydratase [Acidimicrobiia bacterium]